MIGCGADAYRYLAAGNQLFDSGKYDQAIEKYRECLQKDPADGEAYYRLGLAELKRGDERLALGALVEAASLLPSRDDVNGKLADLLLASYLRSPENGKQAYQQLVEISNKLLARTPDSYDGWRIKGYIALLDKHPEEAASALEKANSSHPYDPELVANMSQALFEANRDSEGEQSARALLSRKPDADSVYEILYRHYMSKGQTSEAEAVVRAKCDHNPGQAQYIIELASHYLRMHQPDRVSATLQSMLARGSEFPQARLYAGDFYAQAHDWSEALEMYRVGARATRKDQALYEKRAAGVLLQLGRIEEARQMIEAVLRESPNDPDAMSEHARLLLEEGKPDELDESVREFKAILVSHQDESLYYELGRAYYAESKLNDAWTQFERASRMKADYVPALLGMAAISQMKDLPDQMVRFASDVLVIVPDNREARLLRSVGLIGTGQEEEAELGIRAVLKDFPGDRQGKLLLGFLDIWRRHYGEAEEIFRSVQRHGSEDIADLKGLVETYAAQNQMDRALVVIEEEARIPNAPEAVSRLLAETAVRAGKNETAAAVYRRLIAMHPADVDLSLDLARVLESKQDFGEAIAVLKRVQELRRDDPAPLRELSSLLARAGRTDEAIAISRQLVAMAPDDVTGLDNLSKLLTKTGRDSAEAAILIQKARQIVPEGELAADKLGWSFLKDGSVSRAAQIFDLLVQQHPDSYVYRYHFGLSLLQSGKRNAAAIQLQSALERHPGDEDAHRIEALLGQILTMNQRPGPSY